VRRLDLRYPCTSDTATAYTVAPSLVSSVSNQVLPERPDYVPSQSPEDQNTEFKQTLLASWLEREPKLARQGLEGIVSLLSRASVSKSIKAVLGEVVFERGWLYDAKETLHLGLIENLTQTVKSLPSEAEQIEFLLEAERAPVRKFHISRAPLPPEFAELNDATYEAYNWLSGISNYYTDIVVFRNQKPFHGYFTFLSMKRFDKLLGIGDGGYGKKGPSAEFMLDHGKYLEPPNRSIMIIPEAKLEGARNEPVSYFVIQGSPHALGHNASLNGIADKDGCWKFSFEWRWNETGEIFPGVGRVLVGTIENAVNTGYVDLDQRRTVVFPKTLKVSGIGELRLRNLRGPQNQIAVYWSETNDLYEMNLEQGDGTSAPAGSLHKISAHQKSEGQKEGSQASKPL
jgi:hypothetical protein